MASEERYEVGCEIKHEQRIPHIVYLHKTCREEAVHEDEHLCEHHDYVAEMNPLKLLVFVLVIVLLELLYSLFVSFAECCNVADTLDDKCRNVHGVNHCTGPSQFPPERTHEHNAECGDKSDVEVELVTFYESLVEQVDKGE